MHLMQKNEKQKKTITSFFLASLLWKYEMEFFVFWTEVRVSNVAKTQASFICNTTGGGSSPSPRGVTTQNA